MKKIVVIGHRGAAGLEPENTLLSFQKAIDLGVDAVELDVRLTSDGSLILMHDDTVDRTTDGTGKPEELTFEELRKLDAGKGQKVPLFEEVLDLCKNKVRIQIELKGGGVEEPTIFAVKKMGMSDQVLCSSFEFERINRMKELAPGIPRTLIYSELPEDFLETARMHDAQIIAVNFRKLTRETVKQIQEGGFRVTAWNPDTEDEINDVLALKVDRIGSNFPDRLLRLIRDD